MNAQSIRDRIACFYWNGSAYVVTLGTSATVLATFKRMKECRAYVESYNAKLTA